MKDAKETDKSGGACTCLGTISGVKTMLVTTVQDGKFFVCTISGEKLEASKEILGTLKDK